MEKWKHIWSNYQGRIVGAAIGIILAVLVLTIGFFPMLFVALCTLIGWLLGARLDGQQTMLDTLIDKIGAKMKF